MRRRRRGVIAVDSTESCLYEMPSNFSPIRLVREHFGELDRSFGTLYTPGRTPSMSAHTKHMLKAALLPLLLAVTHALQMPRYAPPVASRAGEVHASLNTLRAPPAPPPVIGDGGSGGGGGGDPDEYLRLMEVEELHDILADWSSRGRIYHMSNNQWVQERHASGLDILRRVRPGDTPQLVGSWVVTSRLRFLLAADAAPRATK